MALVNCPNCGKEVSDKASKCPHCEAELTQEEVVKADAEEVKAEPVETTAEMKAEGIEVQPSEKKKNKNGIGVLAGLVSVVLGIVCFCLNTGYYESSLAYGGDAYTGIQNAAAQTADNIVYLAGIVKFGFGAVLIAFGLFCIAYFSSKKEQ